MILYCSCQVTYLHVYFRLYSSFTWLIASGSFQSISDSIILTHLRFEDFLAFFGLRNIGFDVLLDMNAYYTLSYRESLYEDEEFDQHQRQLAALVVSKVMTSSFLLLL